MKIGVISDTHIPGSGLHPKKLMSRLVNKVNQDAAALCEITRPWFQGVDLIVHAGDFVSLDVITALSEFAPVEGVAGNMDPPEVSSRLPIKRVVTAGGFKLGVVHGSGAPHGLELRLRKEFEGVDLIVFGHSHQPFLAEVDKVLMFNPGSPTDQRWAPSRALGFVHLDREIRCEHIELK